MKKNTALSIVLPLFKNYPSVNEFHVTTDGQAFPLKHNAEAHASFLNKEKPVVITISRDDQPEEETPELSPKDAALKNVELATIAVDKAKTAWEKAKAPKKDEKQKELDAANENLAKANEELSALED